MFICRFIHREEKPSTIFIQKEVVKEVEQVLREIGFDAGENIKDTAVKVAGNIHKKEFRKFWLEHLKLDTWKLHVLEEGYKLPFLTPPDRYIEGNNQSSKKELPFLKDEGSKLLEKGVISRVDSRPHCCPPLTVACRTLVNGKVKKRHCIDLSRKVNKDLIREGVKLTTIQKSFQLLERGDLQATYDLSSAYHHIKIHPDHKKYLGFCVPGPEGDEFYQFECMPFGLASATKCLARITKPICAFLAKKGIRHSCTSMTERSMWLRRTSSDT